MKLLRQRSTSTPDTLRLQRESQSQSQSQSANTRRNSTTSNRRSRDRGTNHHRLQLLETKSRSLSPSLSPRRHQSQSASDKHINYSPTTRSHHQHQHQHEHTGQPEYEDHDDASNCTSSIMNGDDRDDDQGNQDDDDDQEQRSTSTQESENHKSRKRMIATVWKRKSGISGKIKKGYVIASDTANSFTYRAKSKIQHQKHNMKNKLSLNFLKEKSDKDMLIVDATIGGGLGLSGQTDPFTSIQGQQGSTFGSGNGNGNGNSKDRDRDRDGHNEKNHLKIWEKRKLVLEGRLLMYYDERAGLDDEDDNDDDNGNGNGASGDLQDFEQPELVDKHEHEHDNEKEKENNLLNGNEQHGQHGQHLHGSNQKQNLRLSKRIKHKFMDVVHTTNLVPTTIINHSFKSLSPALREASTSASKSISTSTSSYNTPRGVIDIIATRATASVLPVGSYMNIHSHHSNAAPPTPFNLAIMVRAEIKWILCFETAKELMVWLNAFADTALEESAEQYKKKLGKSYEYEESRNFETIDSVNTDTCIDNKIQGVQPQSGQDDTTTGRRILVRDSSFDSVVDEYIVTSSAKISSEGRHESTAPTPCMRLSSKYSPYKVFALVNMSFIYIRISEKSLSLKHMYALALINFLTYIHIKSEYKRLLSTKDMEPLNKANLQALEKMKTEKNSSLIESQEVNNEENIGSSITDTIIKKSSFVERRSTIEVKNTFLERNKPVAGSTSVQVKDGNDHDEIRGEKISWMAAEPSLIQLRGQDYLKTKRKNPSATSLYELVEMDIFHSDEHLTDVGCRFQLPPNDFKDLEHCWRAPDILIISFSLPTSAPKLGRVTTDKKGLIVCGYYQIRKEVRKTLEIVSNARLNDVEKEEALNLLFKDQDSRLLVKGVLLWEKWCATSANDPDMQKRLKFIPRGENLQELKVPSWICRYNGKPLLIKRPGETSFIFSHPDERMMEIDINLHTFPYMFKQAMTYLNDHYFVRMLMTFGFVIEGRSEEELPEVLLGNPMSIRVDPAKLKNIFTILNARDLS